MTMTPEEMSKALKVVGEAIGEADAQLLIDRYGFKPPEGKVVCPECEGTGGIPPEPCFTCGGARYLDDENASLDTSQLDEVSELLSEFKAQAPSSPKRENEEDRIRRRTVRDHLHDFIVPPNTSGVFEWVEGKRKFELVLQFLDKFPDMYREGFERIQAKNGSFGDFARTLSEYVDGSRPIPVR
jgi:hypothetical protein